MSNGHVYAYTPGGIVRQIILPYFNPEDVEVPFNAIYSPEFVADSVDVTDVVPQPAENWTYDGAVFSPPAPPAAPTPAEILAQNTAIRNQMLAAANLVIPALQDAVDLEDPSANPALLLAWKQFRVAVNKVVLTVLNPVWPVPPQPGYGAAQLAPESDA